MSCFEMDTTEDNLLEALARLKAAKKSGLLDDTGKLTKQCSKWRDSVDYDVLRTYLKHRNEKVRLETIALLVESKKSTLSFSKRELELIEFFLTYNIGEKMEFVPFIKKALKRLKGSLAVLQRQLATVEKLRNLENNSLNICRLKDSEEFADVFDNLIDSYEIFFANLRIFCVNNLYPGAGYDRRRSSLQILCLANEILDKESKDLPWDKQQAKSLFDCLLLDTYESNKEMAYKILKTIDPFLLGLDEKMNVGEFIDTAVALANSIRPIDTITAAYMFKILILSPVIRDVIGCSIHADEHEDIHLELVAFLIKQLEKPLEVAKDNIVVAASMHSLYGYLFCLRSLISDCELKNLAAKQSWRSIIGELVEICFKLNEVVSPIVNNSSPEGHLPMDLNPSNLESTLRDDESDTEKVTSQMVLLCAWRTVKEVSLLFGHLTAKSPISVGDTTFGLLTDKQVINIGEHLVTLLSETKHRGAFEQAHVGFSQLCTRLWRLEHRRLNQLPKIWLHQLLLAVTGLSPGDSKLCATRRSAGLPFMVQALLTSEPSLQNDANSAFNSSMKILLGLANLKDDSDLASRMRTLIYEDTAFSELASSSSNKISFDKPDPEYKETEDMDKLTEVKTHALNILRALYKHSQLGELVRPYIADGVVSAIRSCNGKTWAERNAGTLLFSALIVRIFGVQRTKDHLNLSVHNRMTGRVFFERFPSLLGFMLSELRAFLKPGVTLIRPSLQSVLLLLSRLYPSCHDGADSDWKITDFIKFVSRCAKSRDYETRELAARALVPLLTETTAPATLANLFQKLPSASPKCSEFNTVHGYMLQILEIAKSQQFATFEPSDTSFRDFVKKSSWILENLENGKRPHGNFILATSYCEALTEIYKANPRWFSGCDQGRDDHIFTRIEHHLVQENTLKHSPGREIYEVVAAKLYMLSLSSLTVRVDAWASILSHSNNYVQGIAWNKAADLTKRTLVSSFEENFIKAATSMADHKIGKYIDHSHARETVYEFLFSLIANKGKLKWVETLSENILNSLTVERDRSHFDLTDSYLRLLGQVYGKVSQSYKDNISLDRKKEIYELFFDNSWMDSSENNCRLAVSQTMHNLFEPIGLNNDYLVLHWWTMLLNLVVDDDRVVRRHAAVVVSEVAPQTEPECDAATRQTFFDKFSNAVGAGRPDVAMTAFFSWGVVTPRDGDYEMDDTDVFNRCRNYECFEQLEMSELSIHCVKHVSENHPINCKLQPSTIDWLKKWFQCEFTFATLPELAKGYKECVPTISNKLDDFLDPICSDKLQQVLAFEKFKCLLAEEGSQ